MEVRAYLERIGIDHIPAPTVESLNKIQRAHLFSVPYENMDIVSGIPLSLEVEDLYEKIVVRRRGGYCFELNELYGWLLRQLGYGVDDYFARFLRDEPEIPKRRHHVLRVTVPGEAAAYLCDVGVGTGSPTYPIVMIEGAEQEQGTARYRLVRRPFLGWVLEEVKRGKWVDVFSFTEERQLPKDYIAISFFCEHAEASPFNKAPMVAIRTETGRKTLDGNQFRLFDGDEVAVHDAADKVERDRLLEEWFGIRM